MVVDYVMSTQKRHYSNGSLRAIMNKKLTTKLCDRNTGISKKINLSLKKPALGVTLANINTNA